MSTVLTDIINKHLEGAPPERPRTVNTTTTKTEFKCKYCGRTDFAKVQDLATHIRLDHKAERAKTKKPVTEDGPKLTRTTMPTRFPGILKRIIDMGGCKQAFEKFPQWRAKLTARGETMQTVYDAINYFRKQLGIEAPPPTTPNLLAANAARMKLKATAGMKMKTYGKSKQLVWTREQHDLAKSIINMPEYRMRNGTVVDWERVFRDHPAWATALNYNSRPQFTSFTARVRHGKVTRLSSTGVPLIDSVNALTVSVPLNDQPMEAAPTERVNSINIAGHQYSLTDLEELVKLAQLKHVPFCPECGYSLRFHTQAYNVARRHSNQS